MYRKIHVKKNEINKIKGEGEGDGEGEGGGEGNSYGLGLGWEPTTAPEHLLIQPWVLAQVDDAARDLLCKSRRASRGALAPGCCRHSV
jgi:hypothetical protein